MAPKIVIKYIIVSCEYPSREIPIVKNDQINMFFNKDII